MSSKKKKSETQSERCDAKLQWKEKVRRNVIYPIYTFFFQRAQAKEI